MVIFDPNWNPSQELQTQDRSFHYGQKKLVTVFHFQVLAGHGNQDKATNNVVRMVDTRSNRILHPTFLPCQIERETITEEKEVEKHITNNIMEAHAECMHLPANCRIAYGYCF